MRFGPVPLSGAEGAVLAHSVAVPGGRLRKGKLVDAGDVAAMQAAGLTEVTVARLEPGDVGEDDAATRLAAALLGADAVSAGLAPTRAATGRVNLIAQLPGIVELHPEAINAINAVDPMITIATVPEWQRLGQGGMAATIKIIAYAVPEAALERACDAARGAMRMRAATHGAATLIQTTVGAEVGEKGHKAIEARLAALGVSLGPKQLVAHEVDILAGALLQAGGDVLFVLTGSATSDLRDVAPEALRRAGGSVTHFGMPVDPGNLLFLGELGDKPVIGLPGCARSPALNGADWVMERVLCGVPVGPADIAAMGVGGLLKDIPQRGRMRDA
ncbi:molybdopterin-binding protein [Aliiroseovarius sp.]|uniref:molybdopterin-binding protein n=1 Tax=Aliiroseovarius sp. TaxID=1872442 RepID=UPI003BA9A1C6